MQDAWQLRPNLTVTAGVRYSLYSPPYEVNGLQVAPTISMGAVVRPARAEHAAAAFRRTRARSSRSTSPARRTTSRASTRGTRTTSRRASRWRGRRRSAWSSAAATRRCSIASASAWRPTSTKASRSACRRRSAARSALAYETNPGARFVNSTTMPPTMPAAPAGGFPQTPPLRAGIITQSIDDTLVTPSAHMASAIVGFDISRNFTIEAGYVGRFGRDMLVRRDLAMPLNLVDPASGTDYFTAAQTIIRAAQAAGITANSAAARVRGAAGRRRTGRTSSPARRAAASPRRRRSRAPTCRTARTGSRRSTTWTRRARRRAASSGRTRTSPSSTIRWRRSARSAASNYNGMNLTLRRALRRRPAVRHQLHAGEVRRHGLAGRARQRASATSATAATPAS